MKLRQWSEEEIFGRGYFPLSLFFGKVEHSKLAILKRARIVNADFAHFVSKLAQVAMAMKIANYFFLVSFQRLF